MDASPTYPLGDMLGISFPPMEKKVKINKDKKRTWGYV